MPSITNTHTSAFAEGSHFPWGVDAVGSWLSSIRNRDSLPRRLAGIGNYRELQAAGYTERAQERATLDFKGDVGQIDSIEISESHLDRFPGLHKPSGRERREYPMSANPGSI